MKPEVQTQSEPSEAPIMSRQEKNRMIAHLGRVFARRYDIQVLPSGKKGLWATSLDPKVNIELDRYLRGKRESLDDLPPEAFVPKQILYDEESAQEMEMGAISTILHHEAGHAKYTDFKLMVEGQRQAKNEGYLPTSFWLMFEGIEDPRVNALEGEESPAIDRQIRTNQAKDLHERLTEASISKRPMLLQFAYNSFHIWLHGEPIKELESTDIGRLTVLARPLLQQYFENTDVDQRKLLQKQLWDIAKELEKKEIEQEEQRQMVQQKQKGQQQQGQGQQGEGQPQSVSGEGQQSQEQSGGEQQGSESDPDNGNQQNQPKGHRRFMDKLKEAIFGKKDSPSSESPSGQQDSSSQTDSSEQEESESDSQQKPEKFDLSQLSDQELQELKDAIDQLSEEERAELAKQAKQAVDEAQKEALEEELSKTMKLEKNEETGEYEVKPQMVDEKAQKQAELDYKEALQEVEAEEQAEFEREEAERQVRGSIQRQIDEARREKLEMEKAGFDEDDRVKFLLYQSLEDSMYSKVRNFKQAIEKVIPRRKEPTYEGGYFSGPKYDKRDVIRKAPLGDQRFHTRQVESPTGEPRLFIGLLVDNSGSMSGQKMEQARKTMIFFARVCKEMGIPFMAAAFGDDAEVIKQFRQDFDDRSQKIKPKIIDATEANGGITNLHAGIKVTIEAMNEQRRRLRDSHGLIFVITDGGANAGLTGDDLQNYIGENRGRLTFKGFGLSNSDKERTQIQSYLNQYFGESNCAYPENFENLPDEAFRLLRINLMQFQRFLS